MRRISILIFPASALLSTLFLVALRDALGQQRTLHEQLVGAWTYASVATVGVDGSRSPM